MTPRLLWWGLMWESQPVVVIDNELSAIRFGIASSSNVTLSSGDKHKGGQLTIRKETTQHLICDSVY
jgi:hypothetical protein